MKIKNTTLLNAEPLLLELANIDMDVEGSLLVAGALNKLKDATKPVTEVRQKIIKAETEMDAEGKPVAIKDHPNMVKLTPEGIKQLQDLMDLETDVPVEKFSIKTFGKCRVKPALLVDLAWLLEA